MAVGTGDGLRGTAIVLLALAASVLLATPARAEVAAKPSVVGGSPASTGTFPWQAALVVDDTFGGSAFDRFFCGGELLTPRIVQTAAHCTFADPDCNASLPGVPGSCLPADEPPGDGTTRLDSNDVDIILGRTVLSGGGGEDLEPQAVFSDGRYLPNAAPDFDVGWIVLTGASGQPSIDIAGPGEAALWAPGRPTVVSGWGDTAEGGSLSDGLLAAQVPVIPDATCAGAGVYGGDFHPADMVCAGVLSGGIDSCNGDSGGPLQALGFSGKEPVQRLAGVVSWGEGCARLNKPGVYTRVADPGYSSFIQGQIDGIEAAQGLPDGGPVVGSGATITPKKCKKGKRLKKGKCVKKKKKKKKRKKKGRKQ